MLTKQDLEMIALEMGKVVEDNINPQFETLGKRLDKVESRLTSVESTVATKDFVDKKINELRGDLNVGFRKMEARADVLVTVLKEKAVITANDAARVDSLRMFPRQEDLVPPKR